MAGMPGLSAGLRAGAILSGLACAGALKAHGAVGKTKALYVTSSFPKDTMPIDVMVQHQLSTLSGPNVELRAVVLDNQPPWLNISAEEAASSLQADGLRNLAAHTHGERLPAVSVRQMEYAGIDDPQFLAPFFSVNFSGAPGTTGPGSEPRSLRQMYTTLGERAQMLSNFFAMTSFMEECMKPEHEDVDICMYFDPDMLMYQNHTGIVDLAAATFEDHPEFTVVSPPYGCFQHSWWGRRASGACESHVSIVSSRHVIVHRQRLAASLPLQVKWQDIGRQYWEVTMTEALGRTARGQILCGQEFFVVHPPSRYQKNKADTFSLRQLLAELAPSSPTDGEKKAESSALLGTRELVRRFEAGSVTATKESLYNQGCGCCADMMPSMDRIHSGEAFYEPSRDEDEADISQQSDSTSLVNDAAFEWVVRCSRG